MKKFSAIALITALMVFLFWWGGDSPENHGWTVEKQETLYETDFQAEEIPPEEEKSEEELPPVVEQKEEEPTVQPNDEKEETPPMEIETPEPLEQTNDETYCTLSVNCSVLCDNLSYLAREKVALVPQNGIIFDEQRVLFNAGESVFDVLLREMKNAGIHLEFMKTPLYDSMYIEGIANIYEFDAGEGSGWIYKVNGKTPAYGCSQYEVEQGDKIEFVYIIR